MRDLTISEENELSWDDGYYTDEDEQYFLREYKSGCDELISYIENKGFHLLKFDITNLVL